MAATTNLSQKRPTSLPQNFLTGCFLKEHIETQNLDKARALEALVAMVALYIGSQLYDQAIYIQASSYNSCRSLSDFKPFQSC